VLHAAFETGLFGRLPDMYNAMPGNAQWSNYRK